MLENCANFANLRQCYILVALLDILVQALLLSVIFPSVTLLLGVAEVVPLLGWVAVNTPTMSITARTISPATAKI